MLFLAIIISSIVCWYNWIYALIDGRNPLPAVERRPVPWGFLDLLFAIGIIGFFQIVCQAAVIVAVAPRGANPAAVGGLQSLLITASTTASLLGLVAILAAIGFRTGATLTDFGIDSEELLHDLGLGAQAFAMLAVPVFVMQAILTNWFPSNHPLIDAVKASPNPWTTLSATALAAVIGAPLLEEFAFRVLLQGWMESLAGGEHAFPRAMLGASYEPAATQSSAAELVPPLDAAGFPIRAAMVPEMPEELVPVLVEPTSPPADVSSPFEPNPYATPEPEPPAKPAPEAAAPPLWPTFVSAFLFAISHWSHGPDWIPLFFLALGLGHLYRKTHRIVPSIVVHFLLNATSITLFALALASGAKE